MAEGYIPMKDIPTKYTQFGVVGNKATILNNMTYIVGKMVFLSLRMSIDIETTQGVEIISNCPLPDTDLTGGYSTISLSSNKDGAHYTVTANGYIISSNGTATTGNVIVTGSYIMK